MFRYLSLAAQAFARPHGAKKRCSGRLSTALLVLFCFVFSMIFFVGAPAKLCSADTLSASDLAARAVDFIKTKFQAGESIDGYASYVLSLSGQDLTSANWTSGGKTLKSKIEDLSGLVGDSSNLITYVVNTQNANGSFGSYANEYGSRAPLQALAAVRADTVGSTVYDQVNSSIALAVSYYKNGYQNGTMPYSVNGYSFDYRCVAALAAAGEDLSVSGWTYGGTSLNSNVIASAAASAANPSVKDAVYLAKELMALYAVSPASGDIGTLGAAIRAKQDTSVTGQVCFGDSIYDDVVILYALGKTNQLAGVDHVDQDKALAYLNTKKTSHTNSWGSAAGAAWGGYDPKESDLTGQVIAALSFFSGANTSGSNVNTAIQDGLTYLADIQDADTAAITHQWDSTFSTAETLIALKALNKTYSDYAGASSSWVKKSRTKTIAQCLMALCRWSDDTARVDRMASLLAGRQKNSDPGKGSFENSVYSDMWAYIALGEAGKLGSINTSDAKAYILSKQATDGSWGENFGTYYPDTLSTIQAIRSLYYLPDAAGDQDIQTAITKGLTYLKGLQKADGSVYDSWDDPAVDNSELIVTLKKMGKDPNSADWKNTSNLSLVDYLLNNTANSDGSFGSAKNVLGAAEALSAYILYSNQSGQTGGDTPAPVSVDSLNVSIYIVGMNDQILYGPGGVTVNKTGTYGLTALGALDATGIYYTMNGELVTNIDGLANSGLNGWMYKVNDSVPMVAAINKTLNSGDKVIWWYSTDFNSNGPDWPDSNSQPVTTEAAALASLPAGLQPSKEVQEALDKIAQTLNLKQGATDMGVLGEAASAVVVLTADKLPARAEIVALKNELTQNVINVAQKVEAAKGGTVSDKLGEVALAIPANALSSDVTITIKEVSTVSGTDGSNAAGTPPAPENFRQVTSIYSFGPDGTKFSSPITLALRIAIPALVKPENLALAWYDKASGKWTVIPAVVDVSKGLIMAKVSHFTDFTIMTRQDRKSFEDVTASASSWAQEPVELLAGAGVINGVDEKRYEPERAITRAEITSILVKALHLTAEPGGTNFKDVAEKDWYFSCVAAAAKAGLVKGYEDGTFCPEKTVTREEIVTILARALDMKAPADFKSTFSDDAKISSWAKEGVAAAATGGLSKGYPDGSFQPQGTATRAECAAMVYRALSGL